MQDSLLQRETPQQSRTDCEDEITITYLGCGGVKTWVWSSPRLFRKGVSFLMIFLPGEQSTAPHDSEAHVSGSAEGGVKRAQLPALSSE